VRVVVSVPDPEVLGRATSRYTLADVDRRLAELRDLIAADRARAVVDCERAREVDYLLGVRTRLTGG